MEETRMIRETEGPRGLREHHWQRTTIVRLDGTVVVYPRVKHTMWQNGRLVLILGEHDENRQYVWYPPQVIDHVVIQELPHQ